MLREKRKRNSLLWYIHELDFSNSTQITYLPILEIESEDKVAISNCTSSRGIPRGWMRTNDTMRNVTKGYRWWNRDKYQNQLISRAVSIIHTKWVPPSSTEISARPSFTRKDRANKFSTVCAKDFLFNIKLSSLTVLCLLKISNIADMFLSVSVFSSLSLSSCSKWSIELNQSELLFLQDPNIKEKNLHLKILRVMNEKKNTSHLKFIIFCQDNEKKTHKMLDQCL